MRQTLCYFQFRTFGYTADKWKCLASVRYGNFKIVMRQYIFNAEFVVKIAAKFIS